MAEDEKNTQKEDMGCCGGAFFMDMMRKIPEAEKSSHGFDCAQMMSRMKTMCCGSGEKKEAAKADPVPNS